MPKYLVDGSDLTSVANAIRTAGGTSDSLIFPNGFVNAIGNILSVATVTLNLTLPEGYEDWELSYICLYPFATINGNEYVMSSEQYSTTISIPIINGRAFMERDSSFEFVYVKNDSYQGMLFKNGSVLTVTGNATTDQYGMEVTITGDCTISGLLETWGD